MSDVTILNDPAYLLYSKPEGTDLDIAMSAWVSTKGQRVEDEADEDKVDGLINFLDRERHGSPFEQVGFRFLVKTPIFVWREHMRHRMASYNEQSGRYSKPDPEFYVIDAHRPLIQHGKAGAYTFTTGDIQQYAAVAHRQTRTAEVAWSEYEFLLDLGVAKEVARQHMPFTLYSSAYVRINLRSLMNFLSLRTAKTAMYEIQYLASLYEQQFEREFPMAYGAWVRNGKVAP